jgi:hypothetical protein
MGTVVFSYTKAHPSRVLIDPADHLFLGDHQAFANAKGGKALHVQELIGSGLGDV